MISDFATASPLAHKAGQFLVRGEKAIERIAADMAPDLRHAIRDVQRKLADGSGAHSVTRPAAGSKAQIKANDGTPIE